ncbi:OmpA family protein [Archangium violaceum]|uniref:OmpA family protein n=1 Tax=Archangium violaceum TaxID=83451 RepID=UPI00193C0322|nr:OmpA family protein [Archangium violaceum]QRK13840.1 OmpA family protein [Archangium violaceum]
MCLLLAGAAASAQPDAFTRGFDAVPLKATPAQKSGIALEGASPEPAGSFRGALLFDYNHGILALKLGDEKLGDLIPYRLDAHALFAWQLHRRLEIAADVPFTLVQGDRFQLLRDALAAPDFPGAAGVSAQGFGDVRLQPRVFLLLPEEFPVGVALSAEVRLPSGDGDSFLGERGVLFAPRLAVERAFGPVRVLGNLGLRLRSAPGQYLNLYVGNEVTFGGGAVVDLPNIGRLTDVQAIAEMHLATPTTAPFNFSQADSLKTPWEVLGGVRARIFGGWGLELDVGRGVTLGSGYGREALRVMLALRYDETFLDSDGDGVRDSLDKCPTEAEDSDGFMDSDGCPEPDNDGDGVVDGEDQCPNSAGDKSQGGCGDSDGDGVPDGQDLCPDQPGPAGYDGCPDSDGDEVPDNVDKCPDQSGAAEADGCPIDNPPLVVIESDRIRIKGNILFETGSATIQKQSLKLLDEVAIVLERNPELGPVLIEGHTDNVGSEALNLNLSQRRAQSVLDYLVSKNIEAHRLRAKGFGESRPIATNATSLGRAKNRRVDFRLIKSEIETPARTVPAEKPAEKKGAGDNKGTGVNKGGAGKQ